jgi:hypothetical protein
MNNTQFIALSKSRIAKIDEALKRFQTPDQIYDNDLIIKDLLNEKAELQLDIWDTEGLI